MSTILSHYDFKPPGWAEFASPPSSSRNALKLAGTTSARVEIADSLGGAGPLNAAVTHRSILLRFRVDDPSVHPAQLYEEGGGHGIALGYDGTNLIGIIGVNAVPHQVQTPFAPSAGAMCEVLLRLTPQTGLELRLGDTEPVTLGGSFTIQAHNSGTAIGAVAGSAIPRSALGYFLPAFSQSAGADPAAVTLLHAQIKDQNGLIMDFRFDEGSGSTVVNHAPPRSGLNHDGTIHGSTTWETVS